MRWRFRRAEEEAGIRLKLIDLEVAHVMHRYKPDEREYIDVYLQIDTWEGEVINKEPEKCDELKWFPLDDLPSNIVPEVKIAIENIEKKNFYSDVGW